MPKLMDQREYAQILWNEVTPYHMSYVRDNKVYAPDRDWFEEEFIPILDQNTLGYVPESYDCEDISLEANVLLNRTVRDYVLQHNLERAGNTLSGVCEVIIPAGYQLNGVADGVHAPHTIVFSDGSVWFFEAQRSSRRLTPVSEAKRHNVKVRELKP